MERLRRLLKAWIAANATVMGKLSSVLPGKRLGRMEERQIRMEHQIGAIHAMLQEEMARRHNAAEEAKLQAFLDRLADPR